MNWLVNQRNVVLDRHTRFGLYYGHLAACGNVRHAPPLVCASVYIGMGFQPLEHCMLLAICYGVFDRCAFSVFRSVSLFPCGLQKVHVCAVVDRCAIASAQILSQT